MRDGIWLLPFVRVEDYKDKEAFFERGSGPLQRWTASFALIFFCFDIYGVTRCIFAPPNDPIKYFGMLVGDVLRYFSSVDISPLFPLFGFCS